jgi:soluble cytochrome b562
MFGIDQQVQQTADAYRGKPQMLQQKYAQNQQLIDLLALQKLKSDKEEASRQMALSMQGKPQTIADQRESQVLDMTKKEVIDEQAGVMQNKMKQMQDAQKKVLQSAGAPQMPGQATPQPQEPPAAGLAGLSAPNIQGMAGGGIVAFAGPTGSRVEGDEGEAEARRYMEQQRQRQQPAPQQTREAAPRGGMQAGLDSLLAIRPEELFQRRNKEAAEAANYTAEERAGKQRIIDERAAAYDRNKFNRMLMAMAGQTSNYGAIAAGGSQAENDADQAMRERQRGEGQLIDIGPASRAAGTKAGEAGYQHGMTGLYHGVDAAARMAQTGEMAATRAESLAARVAKAATDDERQRIAAAELRFKDARKEIQGQMDKAGVTPGSPESAPFTEQINSIGQSIYGRLQVEKYFIPDPAMKPPVVTPEPPGPFDALFGAGIKTNRPNRPNRPSSGAVDFYQLSSRISKP